MKYALAAEGYRPMVNDGLDPLTATDAQVAAYADHCFKYAEPNRPRHVTEEIATTGCGSCLGGADGTTDDRLAEEPSRTC